MINLLTPLRWLIGRDIVPDFTEIDWEGYKIKLRAGDRVRRFINNLGLFDTMPYFESSDIKLDIRFIIPKVKHIKDAKDVIAYKWILCSRNGRPIKPHEDCFHFYDVQGDGLADLAKAIKFKDFDKLKPTDLSWGNFAGGTFFRQDKVINIGHISEFDHYSIAMQFKKDNGIMSEPKYMGGFTVFDKDKLRQGIILSVIGIIGVTIASYILKACGLPT
jgi:hypothetical protein